MKTVLVIAGLVCLGFMSPYIVYFLSYMVTRGRWDAIRDVKSKERIIRNLTNLKKHGKEN